jgi:hypothetical protein
VQTWLAIWLISTLVVIVVFGVFLAQLAAQGLQLGRAAQRFQRETAEIVADISRGAARAGDRATRDRERAGPPGSA